MTKNREKLAPSSVNRKDYRWELRLPQQGIISLFIFNTQHQNGFRRSHARLAKISEKTHTKTFGYVKQLSALRASSWRAKKKVQNFLSIKKDVIIFILYLIQFLHSIDFPVKLLFRIPLIASDHETELRFCKLFFKLYIEKVFQSFSLMKCATKSKTCEVKRRKS